MRIERTEQRERRRDRQTEEKREVKKQGRHFIFILTLLSLCIARGYENERKIHLARRSRNRAKRYREVALSTIS